jgi:chemotaxis signal transduction protein
MQIVKFRVSGIWVGVDVLGVDAVTRCPDHLEEPSASGGVAGMMVFRGRNLPLIELSSWLGLKCYFPGEERHVVVLDLVRTLVGMIVGDVEGIVETVSEPVLPVPRSAQPMPDLLMAVQTGAGVVNLLEPEVFFRREHVEEFLSACAGEAAPRAGPD